MIISKILHAINKAKSVRREAHKETSRSPHWAAVRDKFLEENPRCAACDSETHPQVHHMKPFHLHPELELDPSNFITLCMDVNECHIKVGHGGSFQAYNPNVKEDAENFKVATRDVRMLIVEAAKKNRLK
jgi:5-methylcytosine-specific restriction enzyme A